MFEKYPLARSLLESRYLIYTWEYDGLKIKITSKYLEPSALVYIYFLRPFLPSSSPLCSHHILLFALSTFIPLLCLPLFFLESCITVSLSTLLLYYCFLTYFLSLLYLSSLSSHNFPRLPSIDYCTLSLLSLLKVWLQDVTHNLTYPNIFINSMLSLRGYVVSNFAADGFALLRSEYFLNVKAGRKKIALE